MNSIFIEEQLIKTVVYLLTRVLLFVKKKSAKSFVKLNNITPEAFMLRQTIFTGICQHGSKTEAILNTVN